MQNSIIKSTLALTCLLCLWGCQPQKKETVAETATAPSYPALGNAEVSKLYAEADQVDIIFFHLPVSVNQDDPTSVKTTVLYVTPAPPKITGSCQAMARLTWMSQGTIIREADVHLSPGCQYLLFMENNQPIAANAMSKAGVDFFNNVVTQVEQQKKQMEQVLRK